MVEKVKLYMLVRTDLASMTPGRIAAQCAHAAHIFVNDIQEYWLDGDQEEWVVKNYWSWVNSTAQGYGTVIVLNGGTESDIDALMDKEEYYSRWVIDQEYHLRDGDFTHLIKDVATVAFFFPATDHDEGLKGLPLL